MKNRYIWLLSAGHMFTDINQGALPAILPFLIMEKGFNYTEVAGLVFAATFASSVIQPLFGYYADKISKPWLMPAGLLLAGSGVAVTGLLESGQCLSRSLSAGWGLRPFTRKPRA